MSQTMLKTLKETLKDDKRLLSDGNLLKNKVMELALKQEKKLMDLLIRNDKIRDHFFTEIEDILIFDKDKFIKFINNKQFLPDSYTIFKNKIGLVYDGEHIDNKKDVSLVWPYKDCHLEGEQTDPEEDRQEIFWNEILAPDEIDRLLDQKVLTNFKKVDEEGEHLNPQLGHNDNLLIRGNNLLALHSIKEKFRNKVKFIYIDPPFNTGSDSFNYNDKFKNSTWLTFMKNRLEVSKEFLDRDEGVIAVHCSYHMHAYLRVLMDEIFENYMGTFNIKVRHPERILTGDKEYNDIVEYILFYSKNPDHKFPKKREKKSVDDYVFKIEEKEEGEIINLDGKEVEVFTPDQYNVEKTEADPDLFKKISVRGSIREKNSSGRFYVRCLEEIESEYPPETLFKVPGIGDDKYDFRYFYHPPEGQKNGGYYQGKPTSSDYTEKPYPNFYDFEEEYNNVANQGGVDLRNAKKPEELIKFLLELFTEEEDMVLDFFLGSGTTAAVAHKIGRRFIGIEQLDYGKNDPMIRLKNVIDGDQSGISEDVGWEGGGSFISSELKKWNQKYIDRIREVNTTEELIEIWEKMKEEAFLSYKVNPREFDKNVNEFEKLDIEDQKKLLIECLDKNNLYVNLSEIEDKEYGISNEEKEMNEEFYGDL